MFYTLNDYSLTVLSNVFFLKLIISWLFKMQLLVFESEIDFI